MTRVDVDRLFDAETDRQDRAAPRWVAVYRTRDGDLARIAGKLVDGERLKPAPGHAEARLVGEGMALVGDDTVVAVGGDHADLARALSRANANAGFPARRLEAAERDLDLDDPVVLAAGDLTLARQFVEEPNRRRALAKVPYLRAVRQIGAGLALGDDEAVVRVHVRTDRQRLRPEDLPVGPAGDLELPKTADIAGASRDQSRTTTFGARLMRALFADSRFVAAVEQTERELGIRFEDEVLRQFNCPSASIFRPGSAAAESRFAARSCVRDPARMRALLPRLAPHLPRVLSAMEGLGEEGLLGLLLVAPDAPLTPSALAHLAQIVVNPVRDDDGPKAELLYEVGGLSAAAAPPRVVFGMVGDEFVVASDRQMAREAAKRVTTPLDGEAGSALRFPVARAVVALLDYESGRMLAAAFEEIELTISADADATVARARIPYTR